MLKYRLIKGSPDSNSLGSFLQVIAVIEAIAGLIVAIASAYVTVPDRYGYSTETVFQFGTFISLFLTYLINAFVLYGLGTAVEQIAAVYGMVNGISLKCEESGDGTRSGSGNSTSWKWKCPRCGRTNEAYVSTCSCGQQKNSSRSNSGSIGSGKPWTCPQCGRQNQSYESICRCGTTKPSGSSMSAWRCPRCGNQNSSDSNECVKCGARRS